jgi:hypothetical protein
MVRRPMSAINFGLGRAQLRGPLYLGEPTSFTPPASGILAVADRIGLLPRAHQTIEFYMRIAEAKGMLTAMHLRAAALTAAQAGVQTVQLSDVEMVAGSLISALKLAKPLIADDDNIRSNLDMHIQERTLRYIDEALAAAKVAFPNADPFQEEPQPWISR